MQLPVYKSIRPPCSCVRSSPMFVHHHYFSLSLLFMYLFTSSPFHMSVCPPHLFSCVRSSSPCSFVHLSTPPLFKPSEQKCECSKHASNKKKITKFFYSSASCSSEFLIARCGNAALRLKVEFQKGGGANQLFSLNLI